ncbi:hypothetical protein FB381_2091 [Nocardioides albertanoniae]|uniref:Condensation domain-containing protein n=1 Tax=Nocardioides albertanoniae TaxID=1175486 RepID=A0A543A6H2_9ACTN|nr:hypothetical protein [Nocardioides albertanoniae]TQL68202.1 hypothetical protein FB381_2091 [Nocardioides albertanoniae]
MSAATRAPIDNSGRLQFADDLFSRRHRGLGSPIANQWIWRMGSPYDAERLRYIAAGLAEGGLSRRLHRAKFPGARDLWTNADNEPALVLYEEILPAGEISDWLQERHSDHLDPHVGLTYRLTAINLDDGTSVVSLQLAHAVGDGGSVLDAVGRASRGEPLRLPAAPAKGWQRLRAEAADSRAQWRAVREWTKARRSAKKDGTAALATKAPRVYPEAAPHPAPESWRMPRLITEFDTETMMKVAAEHGGSTNAWFINVVADLLVSIDHVPVDRGDVPVSLPMSDFQPGDVRSNSTRVAMVEVPRDVLERRDLAAIKQLSKAAYIRLGQAGPGLVPVPLAMMQMLPDAVLDKLPQPPAAACMASNLPQLPGDYRYAMGDDVRLVAGLAGYQNATAQDAYDVGGGIIAWLIQSGPRTTLNLVAAEPDRVPDAEHLQKLVVEELGSWGLNVDVW